MHFIILITVHEEVDSTFDNLCTIVICAGLEFAIIKTVEDISANFQFLLKLNKSSFFDIGIAEFLLISHCIIVHCLFQCFGYPDIVDNKTTSFIIKDAVHTSYCLHEIVPTHWLIDIHCRQRWYVKACKPHVYDYGYFHRVIVVFEFLGKFFLVLFVANNVMPLFRIFIATCHYHLHFISPVGAKF